VQGQEAVELVRQGIDQDAPYAVVFLDMRMPPGWDGLQTATEIRKLDDNVYIVFVTAYSDHSVNEMQERLHKNTLLLHKPFYKDVVLQMARTFCISWAREQCLVQTRKRLSHLSERMAEQVNRDALTELYNRYYLDRQMELEIKRARREQQPVGVLMIDIDWFKVYNDQHGHLMGDQALQQIAVALKDAVNRPADFVARYGGEEFCMVLPNTEPEGVEEVAERARGAVEALQIQFVDSAETDFPYLTISVGGVSRIPLPGDRDTSLIDEADQMLYQVKSSGKNRVLIA
jgi:two-component system chemotaxis family response regulator WspR